MKFSFKKIEKNQGFTLIETLVAITILMISIAGPLTIANQGIVAATYSRDQVIASYLGQDLMESIENYRDNDLLVSSSGGWSTFLATLSNNGCLSGVCGMETVPFNNLWSTFVGCNSIASCRMYLSGGNFPYYTYSSSNNTPTQFYRSFTVTQEGVDSALLVVTVSWNNGTIKNQVVLKSILFNTLR